MSRPPLPPFTAETAAQKARMAGNYTTASTGARGLLRGAFPNCAASFAFMRTFAHRAFAARRQNLLHSASVFLDRLIRPPREA